jgi:hypothetical protein
VLAACGIVALSVIAHVGLGRFVASPWLMPDLTLIGLASVVMARPDAAGLPIALTAALVVPVAGGHPWVVAALYAAGGLAIRRLAAGWDLAGPWVPMVVVALIEAMLIAWWLLLDGFDRLTLAGPALARIVLTAVCLPIVSRLTGRLFRGVG